MKTPGERMPRSNAISNAKSTRSTSDQRPVDTGRRFPSAGGLPAGLANQCPTCLVEMEWIHSHYQCPVVAGETRVACEGAEKHIMPTAPGTHPHFNDTWRAPMAHLCGRRTHCREGPAEEGIH